MAQFDAVVYALCRGYTDTQIQSVIEGLSEGMKFRGSVNTESDLPASPSSGDLYIINDSGCKAVFDGSKWIIFDAIPKNVSQLVNDAGYTTEQWVVDQHYLVEQDIINKADKADLVWEKGEGLNSIVTKGNNNQAKGEASVAEGAETDAHSYASHTEGYMTSTGVSAEYSHAEGYKTSTQGVASHAEGDSTVTNNPAEHAEGRYNKSNMGGTSATNTIHSVGIGNASGSIPGGERKNAYEIMENGDAYLLGVGGYDGKNPVDAKTLQEAINAKQSKLTAGENITIDENNVISATGGATYTAGNGIAIDNNIILTKIGNGLTHTDDGKLTINPADRSINVGEFGVRVPIVTTSLDITDNGLAVKLADDSIIAYNSGTGTKGIKVNTNVIQSKLAAGDNVTIAADGKTISAVDTKYTAGENVTITNNVISAIGGKVDDVKLNGESVLEGKIANLDLTSYAKLIDLQIGKSFTTNVTVGHLESGTDIFSTDTLGDLIYRILYKKPVGNMIDLYFGANDSIPSSKDCLTKVADQSIADLLSNGINHNIVCGHGEGAQAVAQYPTVAFAKDLILDKWTTTDFPYPMDFITVDKDTYNIYYLPDASYDTPEGINYHFTFKEA